MMKPFVLVVAITVAATLSWIVAATATSAAKRVSVTGEIIDTWCIVTMTMLAERLGHYQVAACCAVVEISISIKDQNEKLYVVPKVERNIQILSGPVCPELRQTKSSLKATLSSATGLNIYSSQRSPMTTGTTICSTRTTAFNGLGSSDKRMDLNHPDDGPGAFHGTCAGGQRMGYRR
jgi:hypothetical protein